MHLMKTTFEEFDELKLDTSAIGLCRESRDKFFCTPIGAKIFGWDNSIHYCFIDGFEEIVFCVNPETCCEYYVYPIAQNFTDFLRLLLALKTTNTIQQIIWLDKRMFDNFINDPNELEYTNGAEVLSTLNVIRERFGITPMENSFEYVKNLQKHFPYQQIKFTDEFYEATGLEQ